MKTKLYAILAVLFLGLQVICAQTVIQGTGPSDTSGEIAFGAKAGLNLSTFFGGDFVDIKPRPGAYVGGIAEIPAFADDFYLQPELIFSFQGADIGPENLNLVYVHLPLMGKFHITDEIAVEFGPQIGVLLSDNIDKIDPSGSLESKAAHFGLNLGGGYRLNENLYFQLRFGLGLSKVLEDTELKNGVLSIGACYFL